MILFITKKFLSNKKYSSGLSVFSLIAIIGISIGVAALIIALSVLNGFEKTIEDKLVNLDSHIQVIGFSESTLPQPEKTIPLISSLIKDELKELEPFISKLVIIGNRNFKEGITLKGVSSVYFQNKSNIELISGSLNFDDFSNSKQIIVGKTLANKLLLKVGDAVSVFALKDQSFLSLDNLPSIEKFVVSGIFASGMAKYDDTFAYASFNEVQHFLLQNDNVSGYEIKINDVSKIDSLTNYLQTKLRYPHYVKNVFENYRHIFNWIELQKEPIPFVLGLIIIVAVFNIISTLLMIVLEKMNAIGILRSLGAKKYQISVIFLLHGIVIGIAGILLGNFLAYALSIIQIEFDVITLPGSIYFVSKVPLIIDFNTYLLVSAITFVLVIIVSYLPSMFAARINPLTILRFN